MRTFASTILAVILTFFCISALAVETGVFEPPSLEGYTLEKSWKDDVDKDGVKESTIKRYINSAGGKIASISAEDGRVWGWAVRSANYPADKDDSTKNYTIRDSNCSGVFNERYMNRENYELPFCIKLSE